MGIVSTFTTAVIGMHARFSALENTSTESAVAAKVGVDEEWYFQAYPDVRAAVEDGRFKSAPHHYRMHGNLLFSARDSLILAQRRWLDAQLVEHEVRCKEEAPLAARGRAPRHLKPGSRMKIPAPIEIAMLASPNRGHSAAGVEGAPTIIIQGLTRGLAICGNCEE